MAYLIALAEGNPFGFALVAVLAAVILFALVTTPMMEGRDR
jgi:hypothetical protein